jgi:hypothetical protein
MRFGWVGIGLVHRLRPIDAEKSGSLPLVSRKSAAAPSGVPKDRASSTLYSTNPQTYIDTAPFIEQFFAGQPR